MSLLTLTLKHDMTIFMTSRFDTATQIWFKNKNIIKKCNHLLISLKTLINNNITVQNNNIRGSSIKATRISNSLT